METERPSAPSPLSHRLAPEFADPTFRHTYVESHTRQFLARQMREFRGDRSQTEFGEKVGIQQTQVSRYENPHYSGWTVSRLLSIAEKLGIAVIVRFVDFPTFLRWTRDMSDSAIRPLPYDEKAIEEVARADVQRARDNALAEAWGRLPKGDPTASAPQRAPSHHPTRANQEVVDPLLPQALGDELGDSLKDFERRTRKPPPILEMAS